MFPPGISFSKDAFDFSSDWVDLRNFLDVGGAVITQKKSSSVIMTFPNVFYDEAEYLYVSIESSQLILASLKHVREDLRNLKAPVASNTTTVNSGNNFRGHLGPGRMVHDIWMRLKDSENKF